MPESRDQIELFAAVPTARVIRLDPDAAVDLVGVVRSRPGRARGNSPATSHAAAEAIRDRAPLARERVLVFIGARSGAGGLGATDEEIAAGLGMRLSGVCGRRNELMKDGDRPLVRYAQRTRKGSSGLAARVYVTTPAGFRLAQRIDFEEGG